MLREAERREQERHRIDGAMNFLHGDVTGALAAPSTSPSGDQVTDE